MKDASKARLVEVLLERHGRTFSGELGIDLAKGTPSPLFRWLCASILYSTRISAELATRAARALAKAGWTTPERMAETSWEERVRVLNRSGYARYDESTARMLGDTVSLLLEEYGGDLRRLREQAGRDPKEERRRLKAFKGMGDVAVGIFFREAQAAWDELYPFADDRALKAAGGLGLGRDAKALAALVDRAAFPRLIAALIRADLARDAEAVLKAASASKRS